MINLEFIKQVPIKVVFKNETVDFTTWLSEEQNLKLLGEEIGLELKLVKREAKAHKYRVDILAIDAISEKYVVIENQLSVSDHDHLGKLITYFSNLNSDYIVWIVNELRLEHEKAIDWLNKNTTTNINFFVIKFELLTINKSLPAPKFTLILKPSGWIKKKTFNDSDGTNQRLFIPEINIGINSFVEFLNFFIIPDKRYPKWTTKSGEIGILSEYKRLFSEDAKFFDDHPKLFRKYLEVWASYNGFIINKKYRNNINKGYHRSGGSDYYTFNKK